MLPGAGGEGPACGGVSRGAVMRTGESGSAAEGVPIGSLFML